MQMTDDSRQKTEKAIINNQNGKAKRYTEEIDTAEYRPE
jgi:hypothetical protein